MPFVPGTNAIARVVATAVKNVTHVRSGDRVFLSPHLRGDVPDRDPPQILIGLTATVTTPEALALQTRWRDGVFAEIAHWPAACVTPLANLDDTAGDRADRAGKADRAVRRAAALRAARRADHHRQRRDRLFRLGRRDARGRDGRRPRRCGRTQARPRSSNCAMRSARASFPRSSPARRPPIFRSSAAPPGAAPTSRSTCSAPPRAPRPRCHVCAHSGVADGWC